VCAPQLWRNYPFLTALKLFVRLFPGVISTEETAPMG
jgi:hypothetical protein